MGGSEQLTRLAGGIVGVGIALAVAFPFDGVPPHGVAGRAVPAQVEVRVLAAGVFDIEPLGLALPPTAFPAPGAHGGPSLKVKISNISPLPQELSIRLTGLSPELDDAVTVRGSAAGAVLVNESLGQAASWSAPQGVLPSGGTTTLRLRFKLKPGESPDTYDGRLDVRQLEVKGVIAGDAAGATPQPTTPSTTTPDDTASATTPSTTPEASTPLVVTTPDQPTTPTTPHHRGH